MSDTFENWKTRADQRELLETAVKYGATLKRAGREHIGPCVACSGSDRFSIHPGKNLWNCRGHGGGHGAIGMTMHLTGMSFAQTCEALTGEPNPATNRPAKPLSAEERSARATMLADAKSRERADKAAQDAYEEDTRGAALRIWNASQPIAGTIAEQYLDSRGIRTSDVIRGIGVLRFHPSLPYPKKTGLYPAMVCRVDDMGGDLCSIWRIFLRADGRKADVPDCKLGLGPAGGGAVRIGNDGPKIAIAEGIETALAFWNLTGRKYPCWAALSTSGMIGIELPLGVSSVIVVPDGDRPIKKQGQDYVPAIPAGRKAAMTLRDRLIGEGVACTIAAEPKAGTDYLDIWNEHSREVA